MKKKTKEDIVKAAFEILKDQGIDKVNARSIAKKLNCSVQPIFYQFNNMDELKQALLEYALDYYQKLLLTFKVDEPKYKQIGINYIKFARLNPYVFKYIFMGNHHIKLEEMVYFDKSYEEVEKIFQLQNKISIEMVKSFHLKMWMFTHGIACLIATDTCEFSDNKISNLLTEEFQALMKTIDSN